MVESWLRGQGFADVRADAGRDYVRATAAVATIDKALHVTLKLYQSSAQANAGAYPLYANDRPVTLPGSVARDVLGVTGLDNTAATARPVQLPAQATTAPCSHYFGQHSVSGLPKKFGITTFYTAGCGYTAAQLRGAYGMSTASTGKGQTVALVELGLIPDMFLTLSDYAKAMGLPAPSLQRYEEVSLGRGSQCGNFNIEEQLDVESSYAMAPSASQVVVGGDSCDNGDAGMQGLFDADIAVLNGVGDHPLASIASNSWGVPTESAPGQTLEVAHAYFVRSAAEGVGMYFASGDFPGVEFPTDPYAIDVGGTSLALGKTGQRVFETGWSTGSAFIKGTHWGGFGSFGGTSGGPSHIFSQPAYQQGVVPAAMSAVIGQPGPMRTIPDISADADPFTGFMFGFLSFPKHKRPVYHQGDVGGTSLASPLVAGMIADAQQGQPAPFGFTDPLFYRLAGTSAFLDALPLTNASPALDRAEVFSFAGPVSLNVFDDQSPSLRGYTGQVTVPGYDTMTGIGAPNGQAFINALRLGGT